MLPVYHRTAKALLNVGFPLQAGPLHMERTHRPFFPCMSIHTAVADLKHDLLCETVTDTTRRGHAPRANHDYTDIQYRGAVILVKLEARCRYETWFHGNKLEFC
jgi:hypothetical protein